MAEHKLAASKKSRAGYRLNARKVKQRAEELCQENLEAEFDEVEKVADKLDFFSKKLQELNSIIIEKLDQNSLDQDLDDQENMDNRLPELVTDLRSLAKVLNRKIVEKTDQETLAKLEQTRVQLEKQKISIEQKKADYEREKLEIEKKRFDLETKEAERRLKKSEEKVNIRPDFKLDLKFEKFNGDSMKWQSFYDSFFRAVHDNDKFADADKLNLLKGNVSGSALELISPLECTDANYPIAMNRLKDRFGDPRIAISAHHNELMKLRQPADGDTAKIREIVDKIERHLLSLEALGENPEQSAYAEIIQKAIPTDMLKQMTLQKAVGDRWTVKKLRETLAVHLKALEAADLYSTKIPSPNPRGNGRGQGPQKSPPQMEQLGPSTGAALVGPMGANGNPDDSGKKRPFKQYEAKMKCHFCTKEDHWSSDCKEFPDIQSRLAKISSKCFRCFSSNHMSKDCPLTIRKKPCWYCKNTGHNQALCPEKFPKTAPTAGAGSQNSGKKPIHSSVGSTLKRENLKIYPMSATVQTRGEKKKNAQGRVVLDTANWQTLISRELAEKLQRKSYGIEELSVHRLGTKDAMDFDSPLVNLDLKLTDGSYKNIWAQVIDVVTAPIRKFPVNPSIKLDYLTQNMNLADPIPVQEEQLSVDILNGMDYYNSLLTSERIHVEGDLYLQGSKFGWIFNGCEEQKSGETTPKMGKHAMFLALQEKPGNNELSLVMKSDMKDPNPESMDFGKFWDLESIGIKDSPIISDDDVTLEKFNESVSFENGRYQVEWPKKEDKLSLLPDNFELTLGRLRSLLKSLRKDLPLLQKYDGIIHKQDSLKIIEEVTQEILEGPIKHYIPHFVVVTPDKATTKERIVYDGAAKARKDALSLNDCLYAGPKLLPDLAGLLIRFRLWLIAILSDIEKAFLQLELKPPDRDLTRWLWIRDINNPNLKDNLVIYRFCRVLFGASSSPFLLNATISHHLKKENTKIADDISRNIYVDNIIGGCSSVAEAVDYYAEAKELFNKCSMNLREWFSNSSEFMEQIPENDRGKTSETSVLGLSWDINGDMISVKGSEKIDQLAKTKREILHSVARIFDPLGIYSPLTVKAKLFIQSLWREKYEWDSDISAEKQQEWAEIADELQQISAISIPRYIGPEKGTIDSCELICFCDASPLVYNTVIYMKISNNGSACVNNIYAKNRLVPIPKSEEKSVSLPRLELMGVVIGTRCLSFVEKELHNLSIANRYLLTDSECVLHWLTSTKPLSVFVNNRLKEIKTCANVSFRYVPTQENPADLATKMNSSVQTIKSDFWLHGPKFIENPSADWPVGNMSEISPEMMQKVESEMKKDSVQFSLLVGEDPREEKSENLSPFELKAEDICRQKGACYE